MRVIFEIVYFWLLPIALPAICVLKLIHYINTVKWYRAHGIDFSERLISGRHGAPLQRHGMEAAFRQTYGGFFPFGVKDFRTRRLRELLKIRGKRSEGIASASYRFSSNLTSLWLSLYGYPWLVSLSSLYLATQSLLGHRCQVTAPNNTAPPEFNVAFHGYINLALFFLVAFLNLAQILCFLVSHIYDGNYRVYLYDTKLFNNYTTKADRYLQDLLVVLIVIFTIILSNTLCNFYIAHDWCAFNLLAEPNPPAQASLTYEIMKMGYFTITTLTTTGYGDVVPQNELGFMASSVMQLQALGLFAFALSRFWSA